MSQAGPSRDMVADIRDALLAGQSWSVIGRRIGKSKNSMSGLISRHVYPRYPGLQAELAIIRPPVGGRPKGAPKPPAPGTEDALALYRDGVPIRAIRDRLGLSKDRLERILRKSGVPRRQPRVPRNPSLHAPKTVVPVPEPAPEPQVRQCQYILNDGRPWRFCDQPVERAGTVYCASHHAICYHRRVAMP